MLSFGGKNCIHMKELWAGTITSSPFLLMGLTAAFSTQYIAELDAHSVISVNEESWIGSSGFMFSIIGTLLVGYLADKFGRKIILYITFFFHTIGWLIVAKTPYLILERLLISLGNGSASGSMMYTSEIAQPKFRAVVSLNSCVFELFGNLFFYALGYRIPSLTISYYLGILSFIFLILVFTIPESPYWYMLKKNKEKAAESLATLRNNNDEVVNAELREIEESLDESADSTSFANTVFTVSWWKKFLFFSIYVFLFELLGFDMIIPYSEQFFATINRTKIDDRNIAGLFASVALVGAIGCMFIVGKVKRKPLIQNTNFFNFVLLAFAGAIEIFFKFNGSSVVTICCFCIYSTTISITNFSLNWTLINELVPTEFRATIFGALTGVFSVLYFISLKFFPLLLSTVPAGFIIWLFGFFSLLNYLYIKLFVKKTKASVLPGKRSE